MQTAPQGWDDAFVAKLNPQGTAFVYSTYLGGGGQDIAWGIAVDAAGEAFVDRPDRFRTERYGSRFRRPPGPTSALTIQTS